MSKILIQNPGELPIWGMRLLGLSNKNKDQIGQFGTGLKESIALLARMGQMPIIFSGTNRIDFSVERLDEGENEQEEVCFKMSESRGRFEAATWHGLGIHPNFGAADWDDAWMVFRELVCNSLDEGGVEGLYHDVVSTEPQGVAGATRIYLPSEHSLMSAYVGMSDRLLMLSGYKTLSTYDDDIHTVSKRNKKPAQIYHREVWVQQDNRESMFDYNINCLKLNESRSADWHDVNMYVARAMVHWPVEQAQALLYEMIKEKKDATNLYEVSALSSSRYYADVESAKAWKEAFENMYGTDAVMTDNDAFFFDRVRDVGFKPVVVMNSNLRELLRCAGVREPGSVLSEEQREYEAVREPDAAQQAVFDAVWNKLHAVGMTQGKDKPSLMVFKPRVGGDTVVFGSYKNGVCSINMDCSGSIQERRACLEEIAHHVTQARDYTRDFQNYLLEAFDYLLMEGVMQ